MSPEDKALIRITRQFEKEDIVVSWFHTLCTLALILLLMTGIIFIDSNAIRCLFSLLQGLSLVRMFVIYHDYQHGTILKKSKAASWLMYVYGILVLNPSGIWKRSHNFHHANNSKLFSAGIGSYPIMTMGEYMNAGKKERIIYLYSRHPLTILFGYFTIFAVGMCLRSFVKKPSAHIDSAAALLIHVAIVLFLLTGSGFSLFFWLYFLPLFISSAIGAYLFYVQHNFPGVEFRNRQEWNYVDAAINSSSYIRMNSLMQWFTANIGYHHIHHLNSRIPFYRLPEAFAQIPALQHPKVITLSPHDAYQCLKLKVWDETLNRLVPVK